MANDFLSKAKDKISSVDLNAMRDNAIEKVSDLSLKKVKDDVKEDVSKIDLKSTGIKFKETASEASAKAKIAKDFVGEKVKDIADDINISALKGKMPDANFDDLKEKINNLDTKPAKANLIILSCVAVSAGIGAMGEMAEKDDSDVLVKLQRAMLVSIGNIYGMDVGLIKEVVDVVIGKLNITSRVGKSFVAKLSNIELLEDEKPIIDSIVAGTITFITGELASIFYNKVDNDEIDIQGADLFKTISNIYDAFGSEKVKKIITSLDKKDPAAILDNLVSILTEKMTGGVDIDDEKHLLE